MKCFRVPPLLFFAFLFVLPVTPFPSAQNNDRPADQPRFKVKAKTVSVPVVVIGDDGRLYTDLKKENFTILEDGVPQEITTFARGESPLTLVLLLEYSGVVRYIRGEVLRPAAIFVHQVMGPQDYTAIVAFDIRPQLMADFTQNRQKLHGAIDTLFNSFPTFNESNLFDALKFVLVGGTLESVEYKGLAEVEGRTGVLLVATGLDTFSKITFGATREIVGNSGVPVHSIGIGELAFMRAEPFLSGLQRLTFLQAQNNLRTFSEESGGRFYSVRFEGSLDEVLQSIGNMLRFQYTLGYIPQEGRKKNEKHKLQVLVDVNGDGRPDKDDIEVQHRKFYFEPEEDDKDR